MTAVLKAVIVNTVFAALTFIALHAGYVTEAWQNDIAYIIPAIVVVFILGHLAIWQRPDDAYWCLENLLALGFMGTLLGLWNMLSSLDASQIGDVSQIGAVLANLLNGIGAALWTTVTGLFFWIWLGAHIRAVEG